MTDGDTPTRVRRRSSFFLGRDDAMNLSQSGARNVTDDHRGMFPITITHEGHLGGSYTLYADTEETQSMWKLKLEEAIRCRQKSNKVFKMKILNRESFLMKTGAPSRYLPQGRQLTRTINCITPFSTSPTIAASCIPQTTSPATQDGRDLTAVGCLEGLWIGNLRDPQCECSACTQLIRI